ncbi:MAG: hypothetical protein OXE95_04300 [Chloroflexi bacterium]|nr:hypothetical protein [Chloroflexota bacterium]MCY4246784.1 hypothetical protein [Chloroflexota bacterium]
MAIRFRSSTDEATQSAVAQLQETVLAQRARIQMQSEQLASLQSASDAQQKRIKALNDQLQRQKAQIQAQLERNADAQQRLYAYIERVVGTVVEHQNALLAQLSDSLQGLSEQQADTEPIQIMPEEFAPPLARAAELEVVYAPVVVKADAASPPEAADTQPLSALADEAIPEPRDASSEPVAPARTEGAGEISLDSLVGAQASDSAKLIALLAESGWAATESELQAGLPASQLVAVVIAEINQRAQDDIGEHLITRANETWTIETGFRPALLNCLKREAFAESPQLPDESGGAAD